MGRLRDGYSFRVGLLEEASCTKDRVVNSNEKTGNINFKLSFKHILFEDEVLSL